MTSRSSRSGHPAMPPRFTASAAKHLLMGLARFSKAADDAGVAGIDLDTAKWAWQLPRRGLRSVPELAAPVANIIVSPADIIRRSYRYSELQRQGNLFASYQVIVRLNESAGPGEDQLIALHASKAFDGVTGPSGMVFAVPALALDGGRAHLARLHVLKRLAEEWNFTIGFELDDRTDTRWEAEAAVRIAGTRLTYLRIDARISDPAIREFDVLIRAIRSCADEGFSGTISLTPSVSFWSSWSSSAITRDLEASRDIVSRIFLRRPLPSAMPNDTTIRYL